MAQPIVKYTLNKKGQTPEWINTGSSSFAGEHGIKRVTLVDYQQLLQQSIQPLVLEQLQQYPHHRLLKL